MLLWIYTVVVAAAFALPFYATWRTLGSETVTKQDARQYALAIFGAAFFLVGVANLGYYYIQGKPNFGQTG
jgi:hypothetical protein